jgi:hypothetical protein
MNPCPLLFINHGVVYVVVAVVAHTTVMCRPGPANWMSCKGSEDQWKHQPGWQLFHLDAWAGQESKFLKQGAYGIIVPVGDQSHNNSTSTSHCIICKPWFTCGDNIAIEVVALHNCKSKTTTPMAIKDFYSRTTGASPIDVQIGKCNGTHWAVQEMKAVGSNCSCQTVPTEELKWALKWQLYAGALFQTSESGSQSLACNIDNDQIESILQFCWFYQGHLLKPSAMNDWDVAQHRVHSHCPCHGSTSRTESWEMKFHVGDIICKSEGVVDSDNHEVLHLVIGVMENNAPILFSLEAIVTRDYAGSKTKAGSPFIEDTIDEWKIVVPASNIAPSQESLPVAPGGDNAHSGRFQIVEKLFHRLRDTNIHPKTLIHQAAGKVSLDLDNFETGHHGSGPGQGCSSEFPLGFNRGTCTYVEIMKMLKDSRRKVWKLGTKGTVMFWNHRAGKTHFASSDLLSIYFTETKGTNDFKIAFSKHLASTSSTSTIFTADTIIAARLERNKHSREFISEPISDPKVAPPLFLGTSKQNSITCNILMQCLQLESAKSTKFYVVWRMKRVAIADAYPEVFRLWCACPQVKAQVDAAVTFEATRQPGPMQVPLSRKRNHCQQTEEAHAKVNFAARVKIAEYWAHEAELDPEQRWSRTKSPRTELCHEEKWIPFMIAQVLVDLEQGLNTDTEHNSCSMGTLDERSPTGEPTFKHSPMPSPLANTHPSLILPSFHL